MFNFRILVHNRSSQHLIYEPRENHKFIVAFMLMTRTNWKWWRPKHCAHAEKLNKYKCWHVWAQHYTLNLYFNVHLPFATGALNDAPVITIWSCIWVLLSHSKESRGLGVTDFSQPTLAWCSPLQSREFYRRTGRATFWSLAPSFSQTPGDGITKSIW